jgi:hypothetical protein
MATPRSTMSTEAITGLVKLLFSQNASTKQVQGMMQSFEICTFGMQVKQEGTRFKYDSPYSHAGMEDNDIPFPGQQMAIYNCLDAMQVVDVHESLMHNY